MSWRYLRLTWWRIGKLGAILTLSWPILKPMLPQPVLLLAHLKPVCAHLGRIWAKRNPKRNEKASEYQWLLTIFPVSTKARNIQISCLNAILGHLCGILAQFGGILAPSWPHPGLSWSRSWLNLCFSWFILILSSRVLGESWLILVPKSHTVGKPTVLN